MACFRLDISNQHLENDRENAGSAMSQCDQSDEQYFNEDELEAGIKEATIGSFESILNLEKGVFMNIFLQPHIFLQPQPALKSLKEINIVIKVKHDIQYSGNPPFKIKENNMINKQRPNWYRTWQYSLVWHFPNVSFVGTSKTQTTLDAYESWRNRTGGSVVEMQLKNQVNVSHQLSQIQDRLFKRKYPSQPMAIPKPSNQTIDNALSRGDLYLVKNHEFDDWKIESKYNIVFEKLLLKYRKTTPEQRGVVPGWEMPGDIEPSSDVPLFDCEIAKWPELIPFILVCDNLVDCSNGRDESDCKPDHNKKFHWINHRSFQRSIVGECINYMGHDTSMYFNSSCTAAECPEGTVKCPLSYCIPISHIEDGQEDCPNGEDEIRDFYQYTSFQEVTLEKLCFKALEKQFDYNFQYILRDKSNLYCSFGEDKLLKPRKINYNYQCRRNNDNEHKELGTILPLQMVCDGKPDCFYGDDEMDCPICTDSGLCYICPPGLRCEASTITVTNASAVNPTYPFPPSKLVDFSGVSIKSLSENFFWTINKLTVDLRLRNCNLTGSNIVSPHLLRFLSLKSLDLSKNKFKEIDRNSSWIWCAKKLNLSENRQLNLNFILNYTLTNLRYDTKGRCFGLFKNTKLVAFVNLLTLDLSDTSIGQNDIVLLNRFVNLQELYLRNCPIFNLKPGLPSSLKMIDLRGMKLSLPETTVFSNLNEIAYLMVEDFEICCPQVLGVSITPDRCINTVVEAISSCEELIENSLLETLLWIMASFALFGNIVVIVYRCVLYKVTFKTTYGIFIFNLSIADMIMGVYLMTVAGMGKYFQGDYYKHNSSWRQGDLCKTAGVLSTLSSEISAFFILFVTFDRFLAVRFPFKQYKVTKTMSIYLCVGAWVVGFLIALIPLFMPEWEFYNISSICVALPLTTRDYKGKFYSVAIFVILNFLMFLLIAIGQYLIFKAKADTNEKSQSLSGAVAQRRYENDLAIARQLSLVVITDFLCCFPIAVMGLMAMSGTEVTKDAYVLSAVVVAPINSAINPLLYTVPTLKKKLAQATARCFKSETAPSARVPKAQMK